MAAGILKVNEVKNFAKKGDAIAIPNLIKVQMEAYARFLQKDVEEGKRKNEGLETLLREVFPIESYDGNLKLTYKSYSLSEPRYTTDECRALREHFLQLSGTENLAQFVDAERFARGEWEVLRDNHHHFETASSVAYELLDDVRSLTFHGLPATWIGHHHVQAFRLGMACSGKLDSIPSGEFLSSRSDCDSGIGVQKRKE